MPQALDCDWSEAQPPEKFENPMTTNHSTACGHRLRHLLRGAAIGLLLLGGMLTVVQAEDWPQFLGPQRNGISSERGLLDEWSGSSAAEVWRAPGGVGMSGLAIRAGKVVTLIQENGKQQVVAHHATTGERLWQTSVAPAYSNAMGDGPRATPTLVGERAFVFTGEGVLAALELTSGKTIWRRDAFAGTGGKPAEYGTACSPLVSGSLVIVTLGAPAATVAAFDAATGEKVWEAGADPAGYASPTLLDIAGGKQVVAFSGNSLLGIQPDSGKLLWRYPYVTEYRCNTASPIAIGGKVFISAGENHGSVLLDVQSQGGGYVVRETWQSQGPRSVLRNEWQTSILLDGRLYGFDNVGSAGQVTHLTCIDAATGERLWQKPRFGKGNMIAADGKLFMSTMKGEVIVARASPSGYQELGRKQVLESTRQAPALANGLLYLRDDREIVCLDVRRR